MTPRRAERFASSGARGAPLRRSRSSEGDGLERDDEAGGELRLPDQVGAKRDEAHAGRARDGAAVHVGERGEDPAIEPRRDVAGRAELDAAARAEREADLVVARGGI